MKCARRDRDYAIEIVAKLPVVPDIPVPSLITKVASDGGHSATAGHEILFCVISDSFSL